MAHHHSIWLGEAKDYWAETHASIDFDGKTIFFASNWDNPGGQIDLYRCELPAGWHTRLMGDVKAFELRSIVANLIGF